MRAWWIHNIHLAYDKDYSKNIAGVYEILSWQLTNICLDDHWQVLHKIQ